MKNKVYVVKCPDYDQVAVKLRELLDMMGGVQAFVSSGEKIVLKVNLLQPVEPDKAVTTHPAFVSALAKLMKQQNASVTIADSPGAGYRYTKGVLDKFYKTCGMYTAAEEAGVIVNDDVTYDTVSYPDGWLIKRFEVIRPVLESDAVFNLCKFKTHMFMHMTGAVKNSFGVIPGLTKPGYHAKLLRKEQFANMMLDLSGYVAPRLSIMDAVLGMEGEGPGAAGTPRHVGLLMSAVNPLALDVVAGEIMGLQREKNPLLIAAEKRGLLPHRIEDVDIIGATIDELRIPGFKLPETIYDSGDFGYLHWWQRILAPMFKNAFTLKPVVRKELCVSCGACRDSCPVNAITMNNNKVPHIDNKKCIRCYCCHEMCKAKAIGLSKSIVYRLAYG
jgi:uncharacterized protein (DUF362 family)/Pyruvate/2-oxoacid:ferredoxin oxidoreductase delta subunit